MLDVRAQAHADLAEALLTGGNEDGARAAFAKAFGLYRRKENLVRRVVRARFLDFV